MGGCSCYFAPGVHPGVGGASIPLLTHFDGCPNHLAHILAHAWYHVERYGMMYPDDVAWIHVIAVNLEESTSEWLVSLHVRAG